MATKANKSYRVRAGDNWFNVAEKLKTKATNLVQANPAVKKMVPGQSIKTPTIQQPSWATNYAARAPARNARTVAQASQAVNVEGAPVRPAQVLKNPSPTYGARPVQPDARIVQPSGGGMVKPYAPPTPTTTPIPGRQTGSRALAREQQKTFANTYTNMDYVQIAMNSGKLPLVVRPATAQALGIDENALAQLGYTQDNDYGYWVRPMYEQGISAGGGNAPGRGISKSGGGYGGYGSYGYGGGGGYGDGGGYSTSYDANNLRRTTGYAGRQNNLLGSMPLISWRI